ADCRAPDLAHGQHREIAMGPEKTGDPVLVFLAEQRAGGIDEPAARLYEARRAVEDLGLQRREPGEFLRPRPPFRIGIAPPCAGTGEGRIDEDALEALAVTLDPFVALAGERLALHDAGPGPAEPLRRALEPQGRDIAGDEMPAVAHGSGERQRLAAG